MYPTFGIYFFIFWNIFIKLKSIDNIKFELWLYIILLFQFNWNNNLKMYAFKYMYALKYTQIYFKGQIEKISYERFLGPNIMCTANWT